MYGYFNLKDKASRYLAFSRQELRTLFVLIFFLSFMVAFDDGEKVFSASHWGLNFIIVSIIIFIAVIAHVLTQRIFALKDGYLPKLEINWYWLGAGLILTIISAGKFWFLLIPGVFTMAVHEVHRIGYLNYGLSMKQSGWISVTGPIANIFTAIIFKLFLYLNPESTFLLLGMYVNCTMAIVNLLPIPPLAGSRLFFGSILTYFFIFAMVIGMTLFLVILDSILLSILFAIILGLIAIYFVNEYF